ncbi:hypothetical protein HAX54_008695, partial [Datura stramonium]|nr:hypothetical protein [Datura stramonium]
LNTISRVSVAQDAKVKASDPKVVFECERLSPGWVLFTVDHVTHILVLWLLPRQNVLPSDGIFSSNISKLLCASVLSSFSQLTKTDETLDAKMERIPFLEEQVRKIRDGGKLLTMDIHRLLLNEDNRFDFVNEIAAEAKQYVENNRDEYGAKKAILHVLSNRMNDAGVYRAEAYMESDPFKPGPGYLKDELL